MKCSVVTPEKTVIKQETSFVVVPLYDGEYAIAEGHTPVIGRIGAGELRITTTEGILHWYIEGGFLDVNNGDISILTGRAFPADHLTAETAADALKAALARDTSTEELRTVQEFAVKAARTQIRLAEKMTAKHN